LSSSQLSGFVPATCYARFSSPFVFPELVRVVVMKPVMFFSRRIKGSSFASSRITSTVVFLSRTPGVR
jgi:hypothetical protein